MDPISQKDYKTAPKRILTSLRSQMKEINNTVHRCIVTRRSHITHVLDVPSNSQTHASYLGFALWNRMSPLVYLSYHFSFEFVPFVLGLRAFQWNDFDFIILPVFMFYFCLWICIYFWVLCFILRDVFLSILLTLQGLMFCFCDLIVLGCL